VSERIIAHAKIICITTFTHKLPYMSSVTEVTFCVPVSLNQKW